MVVKGVQGEDKQSRRRERSGQCRLQLVAWPDILHVLRACWGAMVFAARHTRLLLPRSNITKKNFWLGTKFRNKWKCFMKHVLYVKRCSPCMCSILSLLAFSSKVGWGIHGSHNSPWHSLVALAFAKLAIGQRCSNFHIYTSFSPQNWICLWYL